MIMKCVDVVEERARDCKAAKDLRLTVKRIEEDRSFLVNEDKKMEIRQGFVEKKVKAAGAAAPAVDIDMQQLEKDADAKVKGVQAATQNTIPPSSKHEPLPRFWKYCVSNKSPSTRTKAACRPSGSWSTTAARSGCGRVSSACGRSAALLLFNASLRLWIVKLAWTAWRAAAVSRGTGRQALLR